MDSNALTQLLDELIATWENEVVEFKQAGNDYDTDKIGEYFSALSNEANLRGLERAWLVFGVNNKTRAVVGSDYRPEPERLQGLKNQIAQSAEPSITLRNIHVLAHPQGRVVLMEVPAAPRGMPIAWKGHYYARAGESRASLGLDKLDEIRQQTLNTDWTAQRVPSATLDDLDEAALRKARESFAKKYANRITLDEVMGWPVATFLYGGVVDPAYSRLLIQKTNLPLDDVLALDRVQKKLPIPAETADRLRKAGLIEGRKPNLYVAAHIAKATGSVAAYLRTRGQDDAFYLKQITDYLMVNGEASRADINQLLLNKLSDALTDEQRYTKVSNLLGKLRRRGTIVNVGSDTVPCWRLTRAN